MRKQNPIGPDGKITRCMVCDSCFHWARECSDAYESRENVDYRGSAGKSNEDMNDTMNFSLFAGYANGDNESKLTRLVEEAKCCAVLDCGCLTVVCGTQWLRRFLNELCDAER